jgi:hypothetical protein
MVYLIANVRNQKMSTTAVFGKRARQLVLDKFYGKANIWNDMNMWLRSQ